MEKAFLDSYGGQTTVELIALESNYRTDSIVLVFEQGLSKKPEAELSLPERFVLAIEAMEREVNNGGWNQFFLNTNNEHDYFLERALKAIECPETAGVAREAIDIHQRGGNIIDLEDLDSRYYSLTEPIAERLFSYIVNHQSEIVLPLFMK